MSESQYRFHRLPEFDYSTPGAYFITVCTNGKRNYFWESVAALTAQPLAALPPYGCPCEVKRRRGGIRPHFFLPGPKRNGVEPPKKKARAEVGAYPPRFARRQCLHPRTVLLQGGWVFGLALAGLVITVGADAQPHWSVP